ncbi:MAG TPA: biopolymer transporter ExbD [Flavipsychrobacter sp.]
MAEIQVPEKGKCRKAAPPRIDLTPMVDLAFILITFFIYATTLMEDKALVLNTPIPGEPSTSYIDTSTITIIPTSGDKYAYYNGILDSPDKVYIVDVKQLRTIILKKHHDIKKLPAKYSAQARKLHVIIKPDKRSKYENLVSVLDEMLINKVPYYTIVDITSQEEEIVNGKM